MARSQDKTWQRPEEWVRRGETRHRGCSGRFGSARHNFRLPPRGNFRFGLPPALRLFPCGSTLWRHSSGLLCFTILKSPNRRNPILNPESFFLMPWEIFVATARFLGTHCMKQNETKTEECTDFTTHWIQTWIFSRSHTLKVNLITWYFFCLTMQNVTGAWKLLTLQNVEEFLNAPS